MLKTPEVFFDIKKNGLLMQAGKIIPNSQNIAPGFFHFEKNLS